MIQDLFFRRVKMAGGLTSVCQTLGLRMGNSTARRKSCRAGRFGGSASTARIRGPLSLLLTRSVSRLPSWAGAGIGLHVLSVMRVSRYPGIDRETRDAMEWLGTVWGRETVIPDIWLLSWARTVDELDAPVVVDDLKFASPAEEAWIRERGGYVVRVVAPWGLKPVHPTDF